MSSQTTGIYRPHTAFDVLRLPLLGSLLRWRYERLILQIPFLVIALLLVYDGFSGSQQAARNLATITPYVHYRGLVIVALLLAAGMRLFNLPMEMRGTLEFG